MARRKSHSRRNAAQRDNDYPIATKTVLRPLIINKLIQQLEAYNVTKNHHIPQDNRRFRPTRLATVKTLAGSPARFNNHKLRSLYTDPWTVVQPHKVALCERRKTRREVLHALRRTGKGARSKRRYTDQTIVKC